MTDPIFPPVDPVTGALPATTEARYLSAAAGALKAPLTGAVLVNPSATTVALDDSDDSVATTAFVHGVLASAATADLVEDVVATALIAGPGVTIVYDDVAGKITITATTTVDVEAVRDAMGVALKGSGAISVTVDDAGDTITLSTSATPNSTDAFLLDLGNHTGKLMAEDIEDFAAAVKDVVGSLAGLPPGGVFTVDKFGAVWKIGGPSGVTIVARPSARDDIKMLAWSTDGNPPPFGIAGYDACFTVPA